MLFLPVTDELFHEALIGRILHQCGVDTHVLDLIKEIEPGLVNSLAHEAFVRVVPHVCDMYKGALGRGRDT
jgi:hypothetical protein